MLDDIQNLRNNLKTIENTDDSCFDKVNHFSIVKKNMYSFLIFNFW